MRLGTLMDVIGAAIAVVVYLTLLYLERHP